MKSFIFDMDGVIFDSESLFIDCCVEAAGKLGMKGIVETCYRCIGVTTAVTRQILVDTYGDEALVDEFRARCVELFMEKFRAGQLLMKPGVKELLRALKDRGCRTAIASSTRTDVVERELTDAGIRPFFDQVIGGDQVSRSKPNPDIFLRAAEALAEAPERCVVIEDSYNGIRAAKAAGMTAIMVPDLLQPDEEMRELADAICPSLTHILNHIDGEAAWI